MSDDQEDRDDLTRLEDLPELIHEDDPDIDDQLHETQSGQKVERGTIHTDIQEVDEESESEVEADTEEESLDFSSDDEPSDFEAGGDDFTTEDSSEEPPAFEPEEQSFESEEFESEEDSSLDFSDDSTSEDGESDENQMFENTHTDRLPRIPSSDATTVETDESEDSSFEVDPNEPTLDDISTEGLDSEPAEEEEATFADEPEAEPEEQTFEQEEQSFESEEGPFEAEDAKLPETPVIEEPEEELPAPEISDEVPDEPIIEEEIPSEPVQATQHQQETLQDVREFAKNICYGPVSAGGNPPYSLIIKHIKYKEDADDIYSFLNEHGLVTKETEETIRQGLDNGSLLISQISEYAAIYISHRLRRYDVEILFGLAEEIHPSKNYDHDEKGLISKENINQNRTESINLEQSPVKLESILLSTTPTLQNYKIVRYIDIVSEHSIINEDDLIALEPDTDEEDSDTKLDIEDDDQNIFEDYMPELNHIYKNLAQKLKTEALKLKGNAVIGINYQISPLPAGQTFSEHISDSESRQRYKITCTGNVVWVSDQQEDLSMQ